MDLKKTDKHGNPLNLTPQAVTSQSDYYSYWKNDPTSLEPTEEDIRCELQLQALGDFEQLKIKFDHELFEDQIEEQAFVPYLRREGISNDREGLLLVGLEGDVSDHVLKDFDEDEMIQLEKITKNIIDSMPILIDKKLDLFSSTVNNK